MLESKSIRLKVNAMMVWVGQLEREYLSGNNRNQPHLIDVCVIDMGSPLWFTLELYSSGTSDILQGWDRRWKKLRIFKIEDIVDIHQNSLSYEPVDEKAWKSRFHETNLKFNSENTVRQSKGRYA